VERSPTLAQITGSVIPWHTDGISILPELTGKRQPEHKYLYWEFHEQGGKIAVRMGNWKAIRRDVDRKPQGKTELYNLADDMGEINDLAGSNHEIVMELEKIMKEAHTPSEIFPFSSDTLLINSPSK